MDAPESRKVFTITVNPIPAVVDPADQIVCAGDTTLKIKFPVRYPGAIYNWENGNTVNRSPATSGLG